MPAIVRIIQEDEPTRLGSVAQRLGGALENIVAQALAKEPSRRYASAGALARDLRRFVAGDVVEARSVTWFYHVRSFTRRHRVLTAAVVGTMLALMIGMVTTLWFAFGQAEATREARANAAEAQRSADRAHLRVATRSAEVGDAGNAYFCLDFVSPAGRGWEWHQVHAATEGRTRWFDRLGIDGERVTFDRDGDSVWVWTDRKLLRVELETGERSTLPIPAGLRLSGNAPIGARLHADGILEVVDLTRGPLGRVAVSAGTTEVLALADGVALLAHPSGPYLCDWTNGDRTPWSERAVEPGGILSPGAGWWARPEEGGFTLRRRGWLEPWRFQRGYGTRTLAFAPDGRRMAMPQPNGVVAQWRLPSAGEPELQFMATLHESRVETLVYSQDGRWLASGERSGAVLLTDAATGEHAQILGGQLSPITALAFSPDGTRLAGLSDIYGGTIGFWDLAGLDVHALDPRAPYLYVARYDPSGRRIYVGTPTGYIVVYDAASLREVTSWVLTPGDVVKDLAFDPRNGTVVAGTQGSGVHIYDGATSELMHHVPTPAHAFVEISAEGLAAIGTSASTMLFDTDGWERIAELETHRVSSLRFAPDGQRLFVGRAAGGIGVYAIQGQSARLETEVATGPDLQMTMHAASGRLAVLESASVVLFDLETLDELARRTIPGWYTGLAFLADGSRLFYSTYHGAIHVLDARTLHEVTELRRHKDYVADLDASPLGDAIVSASGDGTARVWDLRTVAEILRERRAYERTAARLRPAIERALAASSETTPDFGLLPAREREIADQLVLKSLVERGR